MRAAASWRANGGRCPAVHGFDWTRVAPFIVGGLLGLPLGLWLLPRIDAAMFRGFVGALLALWCPLMLLAPRLPQLEAGDRVADGVAGAVGGLMGPLGGFSGAVPTLWCTLRGYERDTQRAVIQNFNLAMLATTMATYLGTGIASRAMLPAMGLVASSLLLPALVGMKVYVGISPQLFRRLVLVLLTASGLAMPASTLIPLMQFNPRYGAKFGGRGTCATDRFVTIGPFLQSPVGLRCPGRRCLQVLAALRRCCFGPRSQVSGRLHCAMERNASAVPVARSTSSTLTPGIVSTSSSPSSPGRITASSVTMRSTRRTDVSGSVQRSTSLGPLGERCVIATMTRRAPVTRSIAPPMPGTFCPGTIQFARRPRASTSRPPSTVTSRWPPRMMPKEVAESKAQAPGKAPTGRPPASVRLRSSKPSPGSGLMPMMPFSEWKNTCTPGGR